jgi:2-polyprenyl-6-methoxyphenol hydroxylase-like FAD-dependent oxidoreductase
MKATTQIQVVIVGAGMGGLGAAISLRKAGHKVIVLEQAPEFIEVRHRHLDFLTPWLPPARVESRQLASTTSFRHDWQPLCTVNSHVIYRLAPAYKCRQMHHGS